jgi:3-phenylpropionate/cinnamic acid dioxygenase small subunit
VSGEPTLEEEIRRLLAQYCQLIDDGLFDEWIRLFTSDIEFVVMGMHKHGHAELRAFIEPSQQADARGKHMISEPWIEFTSANEATAATDFVWVSKQGAVGQSGRYNDRIIKSADRWQFQRREIVFTGDQPE